MKSLFFGTSSVSWLWMLLPSLLFVGCGSPEAESSSRVVAQERGLGWLVGNAVKQRHPGGGTLTLILYPNLDTFTREVADARLKGFENGLNGSAWSIQTVNPLDAAADDLRFRLSGEGLRAEEFAHLMRGRIGDGPVVSLIPLSEPDGETLASVSELYIIVYPIEVAAWVKNRRSGNRVNVAYVQKTAPVGTDFESMEPSDWAESYGGLLTRP